MEHDLLPADAGADRVDQAGEVGEELLDGHRRPRHAPAEGLAGAALVPVDDSEPILQFGVEVPEEARLAEARSAVQVDQRRVGQVAAADQHPPTDRRRRAGSSPPRPRFVARRRRPPCGTVWFPPVPS